MSARHFEIIKRPGLIVPEAALRRRSISYSGSKPPVLTYRANNPVSNTSGTHTHSGLAFGPASPTRTLIALVTTNVGAVGSISVAIGGVSATRSVKNNVNGMTAEVWVASVPTGTSGSVVLSDIGSGTQWDSCVGVYSVENLKSTTPTGTDTGGGQGVSQFSMSVSVQAAGVAVGVTGTNISGQTITWSNMTRDYTTNYTNISSGASFTATNAQTLNATVTFGGGQNYTGALASFR